MPEQIAVVGMGQMGSGMAGRLQESGYDVVGYDISPDARSRLTADGFRMASSIKEALAGRKTLLTSLPDPKAVREAWLGADGIVAHAEKGRCASSSAPSIRRPCATWRRRPCSVAWGWSTAR